MSDRLGLAVKRLVAERAGYCCEYCLCPLDYCPDFFSIEHIQPKTRGGSDDPLNLALACQGCNNRKYAVVESDDPVSGIIVPLFHPRLHVWSEHFAWQDNFTVIAGTSAAGRATVERLRLNRSGVVNLRKVLRASGIYPSVGSK